uniref:Secreted protein n=1 Tax=Oryza punctata TaxID=4537 RepID=A0A0E0KI39_ORYPU
MIAESAAQVVSLLAPLLVVVLVAAVLASASGGGSTREEAEAEADARAREWARFVFGPEADDARAPPPSRRVLAVARHDGCG